MNKIDAVCTLFIIIFISYISFIALTYYYNKYVEIYKVA